MFIGLLSAFFSWLFLRVLIPQLRLRLIDTPNNRSSHLHATPRGGGIVFVTVSLLFFFYLFSKAMVVRSLHFHCFPPLWL